jgi:hypothetical protein
MQFVPTAPQTAALRVVGQRGGLEIKVCRREQLRSTSSQGTCRLRIIVEITAIGKDDHEDLTRE